MRMQHGSPSSSLSFFVILLILIITVSNYFTFTKIERKLLKSSVSDPESKVRRDDVIVDVYTREMKELRRKSFLTSSDARQRILEAVKRNVSKPFYKSIKEEAFCGKKVRIGETGDGGKYVCNPAAVNREQCTLISLGLNNQIVYDLHIHNVTGRKCKILGADKSEQRPETKKKYEEMGGMLFQGMIPADVTIHQMMEKSGRTEVDLLKIDIESGEHTALEPFIRDYFVCQIFIEIHGTPAEHLEMIRKIARYGFRVFNVDENPYCAHCCEYSFINEMCMAQFGVVPLAITIP